MDEMQYHYRKMIEAVEHQSEGDEQVTPKMLEDARKMRKVWKETAAEEGRMLTSWLRYLVTTGTVLLGVMVALYDATKGTYPMRICYVVGVVTLSMSILCLGVATYSELHHLRKGKRLLEKERESMQKHPHEWEPIAIPRSRIFEVFAVFGYICFALALLSLCAYMLLSLQVS